MNGFFLSVKYLSRLQRSFTVIIEGGIGLLRILLQSRIRQSVRMFCHYANSGGITDLIEFALSRAFGLRRAFLFSEFLLRCSR